MHAVLFDIDGTLIHTAGSGMTALQIAFAEEFDRPRPAEIEMAGRTDRGIVAALFREHGIEDSWGNWERFSTAYLRHLVTQLPLRAGRILPGVVALLEQLASRRDVAKARAATKKSAALTLRDRLSRLTLAEAASLIGSNGRS